MKYLKAGVFSAIGIVILVFLLGEIRLDELGLTFRSIDWRFTLLAFGFYIGANLIRAERFSLILERKISRREFLRIVFLQNFFNVILPFRLGELSYIALVKNRGGVGLGQNIASLIGARALDLVSVIALFLVGLAAVFRGISHSPLFLLTALAMAVAVGVGLAAAVWRSAHTRSKHRWWNDIIAGFSLFRARRTLLLIGVLSLAAWILTFTSGILLLYGSGLRLGIGENIFVYAFPVFISMTPFLIWGGFGSYEGSVVLPLLVLGVGSAQTIPLAIAIHVQELMFVSSLAAVGFLSQRLRAKK